MTKEMVKKLVEVNHEELLSAFIYLDELRESGQTNMFGAGAFLEQEFGWDQKKAREITKLWMHSYDPEKQIDDRIEDALK